jgi:hypothetical protein
VACATIRHVQHGREQGTETNKKERDRRQRRAK